MRFAYIDSNGNEVPIPSVDALALRIELGAITENTQLYDAQADEWGPAHTHEIFRTLSRDAAEDEGFVAPPPVAPPPTGPDVTEEEEDVAVPAPSGPPEEEGVGSEEGEGETGDEEGGSESFGLTLAEPDPSAEEESDALAEAGLQAEDGTVPAGASEEAPEEKGGLPDLELSLASDDDEEEAPMDLTPSDAEDGGGFDFSGMEGELEVEEAFEAPEEPPVDLSAPDREGGLAGGMELETSQEFDTSALDADDDEGLDLETPMSEFSPEEPPSWMDESGADQEEVLDFSAAGSAGDEDAPEEGEGEEGLRGRRTQRSRPSPPKFRKQRNLAVPLIGVVILLAVGIGGYVAWPVVNDRLSGAGGEAEPAVFIPTLAPELIPVLRDASSEAFASIFEEARSEWAAVSRVQEPPSDWLAGVYLARAGEYGSVQEFWSGMEAYVDRVRGIELVTFDAALMDALQARGLPQDDVQAIRERADSGFVAASDERRAVFDDFEGLIDAALDLHTFLVANQGSIEYVPAAAVTTDPVLEVNPATPEIGTAMEDLLDRVLQSLAALGLRDRPTADSLRETILRRIQETGIE